MQRCSGTKIEGRENFENTITNTTSIIINTALARAYVHFAYKETFDEFIKKKGQGLIALL